MELMLMDESDVVLLAQAGQLDGIGSGVRHYPRPFRGEAGRNGEPDAAAGAGDDCRPVFQVQIRAVQGERRRD